MKRNRTLTAAGLAAGAALLLTGNARAANECGVVAIGGTVTCNGDGVPASDANPFAGGIRYNVPGITLNLDGTGSAISIVRASGHGVLVTGNSVAPLVVNALGTVNIATGADFNRYGIGNVNTLGAATVNYSNGTISTGAGSFRLAFFVRAGGAGNATLNYNAGTITTIGPFSYTASAWTFGSGDSIVNYKSGIISTSGFFSVGPYARALGDGAAIVNFDSGTVTTSGDQAYGTIAQSDGLGDAIVNFKSGTVNTTGVQAIGVHAFIAGAGALSIDVGAASRLTTTGAQANGILGTVSPVANVQSLTIRNAGIVSTSGTEAHGIWGWHGGAGAITIDNSGNITATGEDADGIRAEADTTGTFQVTTQNASIKAGWDAGAGIHTLGSGGGSVDILSGTIGALSDRAILDEDGAVNVTNSGTVTGYATLGAGNDVFTNLSSNSFNVRHFADADGDGIRDTENVAVNDFGAGVDTFTNAATGTVRLLTVEDMSGLSASTDDDTPPTAFNSTGVAQYFPAGSAALSNTRAGIEQGHFVNLETFTNAGVITMQDRETGGTGPVAGDVLVITGGAIAGTSGGGVYRSAGGSLRIDTVLNDGVVDTTDVLVVDGTVVAGGPTQVFVANAGGRGAPTDVNGNGRIDEGEGILVVEVLDAGNSAPNAFSLSGPVIVGAYSYSLFNGPVGGNWYLASQFSPATAIYEVYPAALLALTSSVPTLQQRVGNRHWRTAASRPVSTKDYSPALMKLGAGSSAEPSSNGEATVEDKPAIWARVEASRSHFEPETSTADTSHSINLTKLQSGLDGVIYEGADGRLIGGLVVQYNSARTSVSSFFGDGEIHTTGYGVGATLTWYGQDGLYVDAQAYANRFDSDLSSDTLGSLIESNDGFGHALSLELGQRFMASANWTLTPQAQLVYSRVRFESFADTFASFVAQDDADSLRGRLGLSADHEHSWLGQDGSAYRNHLYAIANVHHEFRGATHVDVSGVKFANDTDDWTGEIGLGGTLSWSDDAYSVYGEANAATSIENFGDSYRYTGTIGLRVKW